MDTQFNAKAAAEALLAVLREDTHAIDTDIGIQLDTPYVLQDGSLLRVFLSLDHGGQRIIVDDGGAARHRIETWTRSDAVRRERLEALKEIAASLALESDETVRCHAATMEAAARRIAVLARAVDRAYGLVDSRTRRVGDRLRQQLASRLREAGLEVKPNAKIETGKGYAVTVDYQLAVNNQYGAVEVLAASSQQGAAIAVDRAAGNFRVLWEARTAWKLFAVYDEHSGFFGPGLRHRFLDIVANAAKLLPSTDAEMTIMAELGVR